MRLARARHRASRGGYAMVTVLISLALMLALISVSQRHLASVLRIEHARVQATRRDEGRIPALARGMELLETGLPPSSPYSCETTIDTSEGPQPFTVTYSNEGANQWSVVAGDPTGSTRCV